MDEIRALLENFWVIRASEKEEYNRIKRALPQFRKFCIEQLGWRIIVNERMIKLEKIPARAEEFMGISRFSDRKDYCLLCILLMFLEDKEDGEQFLLSELIENIELISKPYMEVDWTHFVQRKSLVRVLQFAEEKEMLMVYEGNSEKVASGIEHEVLYENTGLSRYFSVNFDYDIQNFESYQSFENNQPDDTDADRGHYRINRVYRQLVAAPAMYWNQNDDPDSIYLRNQRQWVQKNLEDYLGGHLHIHKNAAFLVMDQYNSFGEVYPKSSMISDLALFVCGEIREQTEAGKLQVQADGAIRITKKDMKRLVESCQKKYGTGFSKEYREMDIDKMTVAVEGFMEEWMMLHVEKEMLEDGEGNKEQNKVHGVTILPAAGKVVGRYPGDYRPKEKER